MCFVNCKSITIVFENKIMYLFKLFYFTQYSWDGGIKTQQSMG